MHLLGLGHIGLMIRDIQPALDFYCGKLGFTLATDNRAAGGRGASYFLRNGGVTLELIADPDQPFFSMKMRYQGDRLVEASLGGKPLAF